MSRAPGEDFCWETFGYISISGADTDGSPLEWYTPIRVAVTDAYRHLLALRRVIGNRRLARLARYEQRAARALARGWELLDAAVSIDADEGVATVDQDCLEALDEAVAHFWRLICPILLTLSIDISRLIELKVSAESDHTRDLRLTEIDARRPPPGQLISSNPRRSMAPPRPTVAPHEWARPGRLAA